jgi:site-specific recombinase XerD
MTELATVVTVGHIQPIIDLVCNAVTSKHTKRVYERSLNDFVAWHRTTGQNGFNKATVQAHVQALRTD